MFFFYENRQPKEVRKVAQYMNIIRRMTMGILSGNPQDEPMHYGEVYGA